MINIRASLGSRRRALRRSGHHRFLLPEAAKPALLGTSGLLFLYGVGIQPAALQFFRGLTSREAQGVNAAATLGVIGAGGVSPRWCPWPESVSIRRLAFAGSGTSTATLQATIAALKSEGAAVGYSVAYPFGVAGPILCIYALNAPACRRSNSRPHSRSRQRRSPCAIPPSLACAFRTVAALPPGVVIAAVRRGGHNRPPSDNLALKADDVPLATATDPAALQQSVALFGELPAWRASPAIADLTTSGFRLETQRRRLRHR
ncbi:MAG: hypothetical protein IPI44_22170 [Sulfuritalea sp.]|nr:hypothetical protein [Sulfuritalea sp.]